MNLEIINLKSESHLLGQDELTTDSFWTISDKQD